MSSEIETANDAMMALDRARSAQEWPSEYNSANVLIDNLVNATRSLVEHCAKIEKQRDEAVTGLEDIIATAKVAVREAGR